MQLTEVQQYLESHGAILSGSRARGDWTEDSDWDYCMSLKQLRGHLIPWLAQHGIPWTSCMTGSVTFDVADIQVEVSDLYPKKLPYIH